MKTLKLLLILMVVAIRSFGQTPQEREVLRAVEAFKSAMISADRMQLDQITADQLVYGHSSGKVQDKAAFIEEVVSKTPLTYRTIEMSEQSVRISEETAVVRHIFSATTTGANGDGSLRIGNMLIWQLRDGKWKLLARQAYKL